MVVSVYSFIRVGLRWTLRTAGACANFRAGRQFNTLSDTCKRRNDKSDMGVGRKFGRVVCSVHACFPLQQLWSLAFGSRNSFDARRRACVFVSGTHAAMAEKVAGGEGSKEDTAAWRVAIRGRPSLAGRHRQGNASGP